MYVSMCVCLCVYMYICINVYKPKYQPRYTMMRNSIKTIILQYEFKLDLEAILKLITYL